MAVYYVNGGASGGISKVIDSNGVTWFDSLATSKLKKAGWSELAHVQKFTGISEANGKVTGQR